MNSISQLLWISIATLWICGGLALSAEPNDDSTSMLLNEVDKASNQSLLWGPYRSNLYFGVRPRIPQSLLTGLLWAKVDDFQATQENFRYTCEQTEGMEGYGWDEYDIRTGGRETIHDTRNSLDLTIDFIKVPGGEHGGSWGARIKGQPRPDAPPDQPTALIFYTALEGAGKIEAPREADSLGIEGDVKLTGNTPELGDFTLDITRGPSTNQHPRRGHPNYDEKPLDRTFVTSATLPDEKLWQGKAITFTLMKEELDSVIQKYGAEEPPPPAQLFTIAHRPGEGNTHLIQKVFRGAFEFDILFSSGSAKEPLTSSSLSEDIKKASDSFSRRFKDVFSPMEPFEAAQYAQFSKAMLSNLVGGIGYFYGDSLVDRSYAPEYEEEDEGFWEQAAEARERAQLVPDNPTELFSTVPSRPFFPRGFLWDEGFHLIPVMDWDVDLTLQIIKSWFNLMDEDGWIAREQILGDEARSKVPPEFRIQYPHYANPPTLFITLESLIDKLHLSERQGAPQTGEPNDIRSASIENADLALSYLRTLYPLLRRQYFWFRKTQFGEIKSYDREAFSTKEAYRWRGRTEQHILTSGIDDYPRAQPPHPGELHVDLISWMGLMNRSLRRVAETLGEKEDAEEYSKYEKGILQNIDDLHWDEKAQTFCDATIDEYEDDVHVCHKGYVSILPFLAGLLTPDSPRLGSTLDLISDPNELWSDYGIRSLSKSDEFYGTGENYWRGPVWVNMNYLVIKNLHNIGQTKGPHQQKARQIYNKLRHNLVENVYKEWKRTGFAWEQYNPETGQGQRTQHFTGWTSLVVKIMAMPKLSDTVKDHRDEL